MISLNGVIEYSVTDIASFEYQTISPNDVLLKLARNTIVEESRQISYEEMFQNRRVLEKSWKEKYRITSQI